MNTASVPLRPPPSISLVVPAYNEAINLPVVVPMMLEALRVLASEIELVLVDDGSRDDTGAVIQSLCQKHREVSGIQLSRNFGKEAALTAGLQEARCDVVIIMDADGQHPIDLLPTMVQHWREGVDVVYGVRTSRRDQSYLQAGLTRAFYALINWGSRAKIPPNAGDFRLMDRKVVDALNQLPERHRFMKGLYAWVGFRSFAMEYEPQERISGRSRFGWKGALSLGVTGLVAFSSMPLRLLALLGLMLSFVSLGFGVWVVVEYFALGIHVPGYATIVAGMMFLSGIQLLGLGVLAEYVGHVYDEVKQRPTYLIQKRWNPGPSSNESSQVQE